MCVCVQNRPLPKIFRLVKKGKVVKHNLSKQAAEALKKKLEAGEDKKSDSDVEKEAGDEKGDDAKEIPVQNEEDYKDVVMAGPQGSIISKIVWVITMPLMIPMWCSIPDPQDKDRERYYPIAFVMSIIWIAIFSYFMVWWATLTGEALGIRFQTCSFKLVVWVCHLEVCSNSLDI